jgi:hypothetical protein
LTPERNFALTHHCEDSLEDMCHGILPKSF